MISSTPEEAIGLFNELYGNLIRDDFHNFITLNHFLKRYSSKEEYEKIIKSYLKILKTSKAKIPVDLEEYLDEDS